jgi:starch-binding outer membrane protein, SusD/RagB family
MTMKKYILIYLSFLLFVSSGCENYLIEDNKGGITNSELYSSIDGYNTLVTSSYAQLRTLYGNQSPILDLAGTDIYREGKDNGGALYRYETINAANSTITSFYTNCYRAIQVTNATLQYIDLPPLSASQKQRINGEIRFLRAFYHFILMEQFGRIAINTTYTETPRTNIPRATLEESFNFVISEMEAVLADLPESSEPGRVNKTVVNHYLAKAYLTRAWDLGKEADFTKSISYSDKVIASKGGLTVPYSKVWDPFNENNSEMIFTVQYSKASIANELSGGNDQSTLFSVYSGSGAGQIKRIVDSYLPAHHVHAAFQENDSRYYTNFMLTTWENYFTFYPSGKGSGVIKNYYPVIWDPNKTTITAEDIATWDAYVAANGGKAQGYLAFPVWAGNSQAHKEKYDQNGYGNTDRRVPPFKKFDSPQNGFNSTQDNNASIRSIVLARQVEAYFLKAEALIGLGQFTEAKDLVQQVVNRPGNKVNPNGPQLSNALEGVSTKTEALEAYLIETAKEMLGEYNGRWPMLRRTKMLKIILEKNNPDFKRNGIKWEDKWSLRPIPEQAIELNEGLDVIKDQNPGW